VVKPSIHDDDEQDDDDTEPHREFSASSSPDFIKNNPQHLRSSNNQSYDSSTAAANHKHNTLQHGHRRLPTQYISRSNTKSKSTSLSIKQSEDDEVHEAEIKRTANSRSRANEETLPPSFAEHVQDLQVTTRPRSRSISRPNSKAKSNEDVASYINLGDLSTAAYEKFKDENDYYENRDKLIKQYVECGDKKKGTASIMEIYLQRWQEEERQNVPKLEYCFQGYSSERRQHEIAMEHEEDEKAVEVEQQRDDFEQDEEDEELFDRQQEEEEDDDDDVDEEEEEEKMQRGGHAHVQTIGGVHDMMEAIDIDEDEEEKQSVLKPRRSKHTQMMIAKKKKKKKSNDKVRKSEKKETVKKKKKEKKESKKKKKRTKSSEDSRELEDSSKSTKKKKKKKLGKRKKKKVKKHVIIIKPPMKPYDYERQFSFKCCKAHIGKNGIKLPMDHDHRCDEHTQQIHANTRNSMFVKSNCNNTRYISRRSTNQSHPNWQHMMQCMHMMDSKEDSIVPKQNIHGELQSLKTIYDRNRSTDMIENNHLFKYAMPTPSASKNGMFSAFRHDRTATYHPSHHPHNRYHPMQGKCYENTTIKANPYAQKRAVHLSTTNININNLYVNHNQKADSSDSYDVERFDSMSISMSPSPEPVRVPNTASNAYGTADTAVERRTYNNLGCQYSPCTVGTNATSTTNTYDNGNAQRQSPKRIGTETVNQLKHGSNYIPQPRASLIEKRFTWNDSNAFNTVPRPSLSNIDDVDATDMSCSDL